MNTSFMISILSIIIAFSSVDRQHFLLSEVNYVRSQGCTCGEEYLDPVPPLKWNDNLATLATMHAEDMSNGTYFSHYNKEGQDVGDRAEEIYYRWNKIGENIAVGYKSDLEVMHAWLASEEHCRMIMEPDIKEMGAARVGKYWVQNFSMTDPKDIVSAHKASRNTN